jgi:threonine dehydrogenase-like Zn-dependent dehydrogenase
MRQVRVHGPGDVRLDEVEAPPEPGPRDAIVRPTVCGVCGTDVGYVRLGGLAGPGPEPLALGHEVAGVVEAVGAEVSGLGAGDRVALNPTAQGNMIGNGGPGGGLGERLLVRAAAAGDSLHRLPDQLSDELAALTEPLGVGLHAVDRTEVRPGERVAVFGAGPIGLAAIACLRDKGIDGVVAVDPSPARLDRAAALGAAETIDPTEVDVWAALADRHGTTPLMGTPQAATEVFIEASGAPTVLEEVIGSARRGARLVVVALHRRDVPVSFLDVLMRELTIRGSMEYPADFTRMIRLLERTDLTAMISDRFGLDDALAALALAESGRSAGKILVEIPGGRQPGRRAVRNVT